MSCFCDYGFCSNFVLKKDNNWREIKAWEMDFPVNAAIKACL